MMTDCTTTSPQVGVELTRGNESSFLLITAYVDLNEDVGIINRSTDNPHHGGLDLPAQDAVLSKRDFTFSMVSTYLINRAPKK